MDIWLYSDETQPNEIRLSDPTQGGPVVVYASGAGASVGVSAVSSVGLRLVTLSGVGSSVGAVIANGSTRNRRKPSYAVSFRQPEFSRQPVQWTERRPDNFVDRMRGNG